jgi:3-methylcrotonyl-CoA carboxylase alpha subunit
VQRGPDRAAAAAGVARLLADDVASEDAQYAQDANSPWFTRDAFQLGGSRSITVPVVIDGGSADAIVSYGEEGMKVTINRTAPAADARTFAAGDEVFVVRHGRQTRVRLQDISVAAGEAGTGDGLVKAPMHGRVLELFVSLGDAVTSGQRLAVIEAMKMEHTLRAPFAGTVREVAVAAGVQVVEGGKIIVIERAVEG